MERILKKVKAGKLLMGMEIKVFRNSAKSVTQKLCRKAMLNGADDFRGIAAKLLPTTTPRQSEGVGRTDE
jgi:hypothetical protein